MFDDQKGEGLGLVANRQPWAMPMVALRSHGSPELQTNYLGQTWEQEMCLSQAHGNSHHSSW